MLSWRTSVNITLLAELTTRYDDPEKIHEKVIHPKIVRLWTAVIDTFEIKIEHTGGIVQNVAVELSQGDYGLKWVSQGMTRRDQICHKV